MGYGWVMNVPLLFTMAESLKLSPDNNKLKLLHFDWRKQTGLSRMIGFNVEELNRMFESV